MKHLFLTSQAYYVVGDIARKLGEKLRLPMVYIDTCLKSRKYKDGELDFHYKNKQAFLDSGFHYDMYDITGKTEVQISSDLSKYQLMYIEGGNTPFLLKQTLTNNFKQYVQQRVKQGMIYISESAGSVIAGPDISSNGRPGKMPSDYGLTDSTGFNLVNFVIFPHWGDPKKKTDYLQNKAPQAYSSPFPHIILNNHQYVEVVDEQSMIIDVRNNT